MVFDFGVNMKISSLFLFLFPCLLYSQSYVKDHTGVKVGLTINLGSHINAVGVNFNAYYTDYFFNSMLEALFTFMVKAMETE